MGLNTLSILIGYFIKSKFGRVGLFSNPPPQLGQTFFKLFSTHCLQKVHSKEQIIAHRNHLVNFCHSFRNIV